MGSSSRAARPAPLYTTSHSSQAMASPTTYYNTPRSAGTMDSVTTFPPISYNNKRTDSTTSTASSASTASHQMPGHMSRKVSTGSVNANSYCGRHSNQYLFDGWGDIVKGVFHPKKN